MLLLSRNSVYPVRTAVTVAFITRTARGIPVEVPLDEEDGMPARSVVNLDEISTIPKHFLERVISTLAPEKMAQVRRAILFALDLEEV